jgi:hypothetical protein
MHLKGLVTSWFGGLYLIDMFPDPALPAFPFSRIKKNSVLTKFVSSLLSALVIGFSACGPYLPKMSSSEEDFDDKKSTNKHLFVKLLSENEVVFEKSRVPKVVQQKKEAWETITEEYSKHTGKQWTAAQLNKLLTNMKSQIKKKGDMKETGNKPIKMKEWEKDLLLLLSQEDNPVFKKVPGALSVGGIKTDRNREKDFEGMEEGIEDNRSLSPTVAAPSTSSKASTDKYIRPATKKVAKLETDETKDLSLSQLQRVVLLKQLQLLNLQIDREKKELEKNKKVDESTQTEV